MTQALSPEEAAAIRQFVDAGGTVIADVRPGIYDGHCKPVTPGVLDDLFGIERDGRGVGVEGALALNTSIGGSALRADLGSVRFDAEVQATEAETSAEVSNAEHAAPVLLVNEVGEGRAVLLNFQLPTADPREPSATAARKLLGALYALGGAEAPIASTAPDGGPLPLTETRVWQSGDALVFGLWRQMENAWFSPKSGTTAGKPVPARVTLPSPRNIYDLRAQRYLGQVEALETRLRWGRASFFLALPYEIGPVRVTLSPREPEPGEAITASIRLDVPERAEETFAVWTEVVDPDGNAPLWGRQVVLLEGGRAEVRIARAFNDDAGTWRVRATELFSSQTAEASWTVEDGRG
jgi:hypothetical protein